MKTGCKAGNAGENGEDIKLKVSLKPHEKEGDYLFILANDGSPFPKDVGIDNSQTLGLRRISALVSQLHEELTLEKAPHPVFTITFSSK